MGGMWTLCYIVLLKVVCAVGCNLVTFDMINVHATTCN